MKVLIGFVSKSDPWKIKNEGPALIVTAAKALAPDVVYLLHTNDTKENAARTETFLHDNLNPKPEIYSDGFCLDIPDPGDYHRFKDLLPGVLQKIDKQNPGNFYLISGLPQARFIFALCLNARVINGELLEAKNPDPKNPWPKERALYEGRLKCLDLKFFKYFQELLLNKYKQVRLRLDLRDGYEQAYIDNHRLDLRLSKGTDGVSRPRAFQVLTLLAAKAKYSADDYSIIKGFIKDRIYRHMENPEEGIPKAIASVNKQARKCTKKSPIPLDELIISLSPGIYQFVDNLIPYEEKIDFKGDLNNYLKSNLGFRQTDLSEHFPLL